MESGSGAATRYVVQIIRNGAEAFGWEIRREADSVVVNRSTRLFATRIEAIFDSVATAATLSNVVIEPAPVEGENENGD